MENYKPLSRVTLSEQVATQIGQMISTGKWKPNEKLPSEPQLCGHFSIGRSTLREALKSLAFLGLVEMRHGDGTYVMQGPSKVLDKIVTHGLLSAESLNDLTETRIALESELVTLSAQRATSEDLANLDQLVRQMEQSVSGDGRRFLELDLEFHLTVAASSKNQLLASLLQTIREILKELIAESQELPGARGLACAHHLKILEALKEHNPRKARSAMRTHLGVFQRRYKMLLKAIKSEDSRPELSKHERPNWEEG